MEKSSMPWQEKKLDFEQSIFGASAILDVSQRFNLGRKAPARPPHSVREAGFASAPLHRSSGRAGGPEPPPQRHPRPPRAEGKRAEG